LACNGPSEYRTRELSFVSLKFTTTALHQQCLNSYEVGARSSFLTFTWRSRSNNEMHNYRSSDVANDNQSVTDQTCGLNKWIVLKLLTLSQIFSCTIVC